jgi:hypothetical protein
MLGKHTLDPNEKTELKVTYGTEGRPGTFQKRVILSTNIPGQEKIEIFAIKGEVREAPAAKISVSPRRIVLEGIERTAGKKQALSVTNEGSLPLVIDSIRSKDGKTIYFDGAREGNIAIEPSQTKTIEIQLAGDNGEEAMRDLILIDSNAKNAGKSGYFLIVQYGTP